MSETVRAVITTPRAFGRGESFSLFDFGPFLDSLSPHRIALEFQRRNAQQSVIDLIAEFHEAGEPGPASLFKEVLIRTEPDADFECAFPRVGAVTPYDDEWIHLSVEPEVACLPSGKSLAIALPLLDAAPDIFRQAHLTDSVVAYRVTLERCTGSIERARLLVPALAELANGRHRIEGLEAALSHAVSLLRGNGWSAIEKIGIPRASRTRDAPWVEALVRKHLRGIAPYVPDDLLTLGWDTPAEAALESATLQQHVARLRDDSFLTLLMDRLVPSAAGPQSLLDCLGEATHGVRQTTYGDYAFISYAHRDATFVNALTNALESFGANYWIDSRMDPGARWDETLEHRIRNCAVLVACLSDDYQESKYCRRELKFADLIDKPIIPVAPSVSVWRPGLQMMFQELQIGACDNERGFADVHAKMATIAPHIFH